MTLSASTATAAVRAGIASDRHHGAVVPPLHLSANFAFERFNKPREFDYTRSGNPTRAHLADALAALEGGVSAVVTSTGMSAVALVLQLVKPGDVVLAAHDCYGGTQRLLRGLAGRGHFTLVFTDLTTSAGLDEIARCRPRIVWVETPSNPLLRITDVAAVASVARAVGSIVVVDNTFLSPALQQPLSLGADLVVHSTTKYLNGHSDVVGGCVVAGDAALGDELKWWGNALGVTGAPFDSYLTLRGLRTLHVRIRQHVENAEAIVGALREHPAVHRLYYPGLSTHVGHDVARRQQRAFGAMASFEISGGVQAVERFADRLRHFTLAESLGGVESLVAHPATMTHASMSGEARAAAGISDSLVRLSIGIESADDLVADLRQALDAAARARPVWSVPGLSASPGAERADVILLGAGSIARELIEQVSDCASGQALRICGLIDRSGHVFDADGIAAGTLAELSAHKKSGRSLAEHAFGSAAAPESSVESVSSRPGLVNPILVDLTAADTSSLLEVALNRGFDLVLANKVPLAGDQQVIDNLFVAAALGGRRILSEATVGAGLPVLDTIRKLSESGDEVLCIEGCPSGTLGYLLGEVGRGVPFSEALRSAVAGGFTEPDPRVDLSGLDVARKALILARLIGYRGSLSDVRVDSLVPDSLSSVSLPEFFDRVGELDDDWAARVQSAAARGEILRYRARVTPAGIAVGLVGVSAADPLASLTGTDNQFAITTRRYRQPLVITGPGAGAPVTAAGVFADILRLIAERRTVALA
ncbi:MAG TPA: cystathionine gamma-synthase [Gemmatimonadaceae bacterium]|nr:cystathionine gamma-synthase [Gemmatimonadaceae bacterium]